MPTDPATVPPLTDADIVRILREVGYVISSGRDADTVKNNPDGAASARAAYALAASRVDTAEVERRAARKAWDAACTSLAGEQFVPSRHRLNVARDEYLAREYPAPAPRECVLSDGRVVTTRYSRIEEADVLECGMTIYSPLNWPRILTSKNTGADFDALKRFAAEVE